MDIGLVLQTDPPGSAVVDLLVRAEELGFSHGWTFDSHVLWQEPYVIRIAGAGADVAAGRRADGDQPGHPRLDRHRLAARHAQRDARQPDRLRDRPRRLRGAGAGPQADDPGPARGRGARDPRAGRGASRRRRGHGDPDPVGARRRAAPGVGGRLRAEGAGADRPLRGRLHPAARRPVPRRVDGQVGARGGGGGGPRPRGADDLRGRAGLRRRRPRRTPASSAAGSAGWSATTSPTS